MNTMKYFFLCTFFLFLSACTCNNTKLKNISVLSGTDTAVVGISLDAKGYPQHTVGRIDVKPGQKILFAGPEKFSIFFKNGTSPYNDSDFRSLPGLNRESLQKRRVELTSVNNIVVVAIPKDLFDRPENRGKPYIDYYYGINVNGLEIDPPFRVIPN
jgi:hypothetical protein